VCKNGQDGTKAAADCAGGAAGSEPVLLSTLQICPSCGAGIGQVATVPILTHTVGDVAWIGENTTTYGLDPDPRDAEIERLRQRIEELEALLREALEGTDDCWAESDVGRDILTRIRAAIDRKEGV
jgi:hypothetical protein